MKKGSFAAIAFIFAGLMSGAAGAQAEEGEFFSIYETEAIACADLPEAVRAYNQDAQLNQRALSWTLRKTADSLSGFSSQDGAPGSDLLKMIEDLEDALFLSQTNEMALSDRSAHIEYLLEGCLSRPSGSLAE